MIDHATHIEELRKWVVETRRDKLEFLRTGGCKDYSSYQHYVGWIQALEEVLGESNRLAKPEEPKQEDEEDGGYE